MALTKQATVKLFPTNDLSRVDIVYSNVKDIRVFLTTGSNHRYVQTYRQSLLQDFIYIIQGYIVTNFSYSNDIPEDISRMFHSVCELNNKYDRFRTIEPLQGSQVQNIPNVDQKNEPSVRDVFQPLMYDVMSLLANPSSINNRPVINRVLSNMQNMVNSLSDRTGNLRTTEMSNNLDPSLLPRSQSRPPNFSTPYFSSLSNFSNLDNVQVPVPSLNSPYIQPIAEPAPAPTTCRISRTMEHVPSVQQRHITDILPESIFQDLIQSTYVNQPNQHDIKTTEPDVLPRFHINEFAPREVIINDAENNQVSQDNQDVKVEEPSNYDMKTNEEKHLFVQPIPTHQTTLLNISSGRNQLSSDTIKLLAKTIHDITNTTNMRPPDFTNSTRRGYIKIRNFIHNITKNWLNKNEIDQFIVEMNLLNT